MYAAIEHLCESVNTLKLCQEKAGEWLQFLKWPPAPSARAALTRGACGSCSRQSGICKTNSADAYLHEEIKKNRGESEKKKKRNDKRGVLAAAHVVFDGGAIVHVAAQAIANWLLRRPLSDWAHARSLLLHHCDVLIACRAAVADLTLRRSPDGALLLSSLLKALCMAKIAFIWRFN